MRRTRVRRDRAQITSERMDASQITSAPMVVPAEVLGRLEVIRIMPTVKPQSKIRRR